MGSRRGTAEWSPPRQRSKHSASWRAPGQGARNRERGPGRVAGYIPPGSGQHAKAPREDAAGGVSAFRLCRNGPAGARPVLATAYASGKKEFVELFGELLERSYINKIESYTGEQTVQYTKETIAQDGSSASVRTAVVNKRDLNVEVEYKLLQRDGNWQVYDVVIEGVSLVNNYRTQFHNIVTQESYDALVKKLKLKLEQERAATPKCFVPEITLQRHF